MILEADVERAVTFLRESAMEAAQARANVRYLESWLKTLRATLKIELGRDMSNAGAEDVALASPQFREALEGYRTAVEADSRHTFKREAASAMISAWQTQSKMQLSEGRAYQ